jgi:hypothetical protein
LCAFFSPGLDRRPSWLLAIASRACEWETVALVNHTAARLEAFA